MATKAAAKSDTHGKQFTVSDGELVLTLTAGEGGWYTVESPLDPSLVTQGRSIEECFDMARDALEGLHEVRKQYHEVLNKVMTEQAKPTRSTASVA